MTTSIKLLDVVAPAEDVPEKRLLRGQAGTVVEILGTDAFEVEFCDDEGRTYTSMALSAPQLMLLHFRRQSPA